jgi:hypothetical protein
MKHILPLLTIWTAFACRPSLQKCNDLYGHCGRIDTLTRTVEYRDTTVITDKVFDDKSDDNDDIHKVNY